MVPCRVLNDERLTRRGIMAAATYTCIHLEGHCMRVPGRRGLCRRKMRRMREEGRITSVPYELTKPVATFWDLGWGDNTGNLVSAVGWDAVEGD